MQKPCGEIPYVFSGIGNISEGPQQCAAGLLLDGTIRYPCFFIFT